MTDSQITKIEDRWIGRLLERSIFGLNIFRANTVQCPIEDDPQLEFLRGICLANRAGVNIGNLYDYANGPEELFAGTNYAGKYRIVRTGHYGGEFYDSEQWDSFPPLFFETVDRDFLSIKTHDDSLLRKILQVDAIAFFVSLRDHAGSNGFEALLNEPLVSSQVFIDKSLDLCRLVLVSQADGDYFTFFARTEEDLAVVNTPLAAAVCMIQESEWYTENRADLNWDDEFSMCLLRRDVNSREKMTP